MTKMKSLISKRSKLISSIHSFPNLMKGTVYKLHRKCSNPNCKCNKENDYLHSSFVLTFSKNGKSKILSLKSDQQLEVKKLTENYKKIKNLITQITDINIEVFKQEKLIKKVM